MSVYLNVKLKRVYDSISEEDGVRYFADRLWPRGLSKKALYFDEWVKPLCPSNVLRKQFHEGEVSFSKFSELYKEELSCHYDSIQHIAHQALQSPVTLLTAAKDPKHSHIAVLRQVLIECAEELNPQTISRASSVCYTPQDDD